LQENSKRILLLSMFKNTLCFLLFLFFFQTSFLAKADSKHYADSVETVLSKMKDDTAKVKLMNSTSWKIHRSEAELAIGLANRALEISKKINYTKGIAADYNLLGSYQMDKGDYTAAKDFQLKALALLKGSSDMVALSRTYNFLGNISFSQANYPEAVVYFIEASKYAQKIPDEMMVAFVENNIGVIYKQMKNYPAAIEYINRSLKYSESVGDSMGLADSYCNIGDIYIIQKKENEAIDLFDKALVIYTKLGNKAGMATVYTNMTTIYEDRKEYPKALENYKKALDISIELEDRQGEGNAYVNMANVYFLMNRIPEAILYNKKALEIAIEVGDPTVMEFAYEGLGKTSEKAGNYKEAVYYYSKFHTMKDSIFNKDNNDLINELQTKYDTEKKAQEIKLLSKDKEVQRTELKRQTTTRNFFIVLSVLFVIGGLFIFRSYKQKKRANAKLSILNRQITEQKQEVELQKHIVDEKNKEITDSIHYAKRIQKVLLTSDQYLDKHLPSYFILYKPKDIVSGDFYWALQQDNKFLITAADCTGHGVPGAFMSLLGINFLNEITIERKISSPNEILDTLRNEIISALNPEGTEAEARDGMDAVMCRFDFAAGKLDFAAANNPLWIVRKGKDKQEILEFKPDKMPVGISGTEMRPFSLQTVDIQKDDAVFIFTDGYADQFGGPQGKKFRYKQLQELLLENCHRPMEEQKALLANIIEEWRGTLEQVDDILVIGIRI
jgi:serine phosphatase RsbU (regulator of sigma subunit)